MRAPFSVRSPFPLRSPSLTCIHQKNAPHPSASLAIVTPLPLYRLLKEKGTPGFTMMLVRMYSTGVTKRDALMAGRERGEREEA